MSSLPGERGLSSLAALWADLRRSATLFLLHFIEGDQDWGSVRFMGILVILILCVCVSRLFETPASLPLFESFLATTHLNELLPAPVLSLAEFLASFFTRQTFRHAIPAALGFGLALYFGAKYVQDLLELPSLRPASNFLTASLFGSNYPHMTIAEGKATVYDPETNPMLKIGGPGWVDIKPGNAALFERMVGPSQVLGSGTHFIRRFETVREAFDLREMERVRDNVEVMTRDGIPLVLSEVRIRFRIRAHGARSEINPYPVTPGAIRQAVYGRGVKEQGLESWPDMIFGDATLVITRWIARRRLDELIPPPANKDQNAPPVQPALPYRQAIHQLFQDKNTRETFARSGGEIIWVSVGHLRPDPNIDPEAKLGEDVTGRDKIQEQIIKTWKASWEAHAQDEIADAIAYGDWIKEYTYAEMQAKVIRGLTDGLREAQSSGLPIAEVITSRVREYVGRMANRAVYGENPFSSLLLRAADEVNRPTKGGKGG